MEEKYFTEIVSGKLFTGRNSLLGTNSAFIEHGMYGRYCVVITNGNIISYKNLYYEEYVCFRKMIFEGIDASVALTISIL